jgi:DNA helicase-2/ATP-dependent DNA helicase PcrA
VPWYDDLDPEQRVAASHVGSHARVLAGPGTGKTLVMARRVAFLVTDRQIIPTAILALTFTRHAAAELRQRVKGLVEAIPGPRVSTLHSFALRQLVRNWDAVSRGARGPIRIADDFEQRWIVIEDLKTMLRRSVRDTKESLNLLAADWETLDAEQVDWRRLFPDGPFLDAWEEHRTVYGYMLRDELVYRLKRALDQNPDFKLEGSPRHLLVDEYQDLNRCDLAVVRALAQRGAELFAAGDDDQSIYGFRFAHPEGIRRFCEEYPESRSMDLALCRRCDPAILRLGQFVASQDYQRMPKPLRPEDGRGEGVVDLLNFPDQYREATKVAALCHTLIHEHGCLPHDILVLVRYDRYGAYSSVLRQALSDAHVPVSVGAERDPFGGAASGGVRPARKLLALMRLAVQPQDHLAWRTLLQCPGNGIGAGAIDSIYHHARDHGPTFYAALQRIELSPGEIRVFGPRVAAQVRRVRVMAEQLASDVQAAADLLVPTSLADGLRPVAQTLIPEADVCQETLDFIGRAAEDSAAEDLPDLVRALAASSEDIEQHIEEGRVNVLTMHKAKGLTAQAVFVVAAEDQVIPGWAQKARDIDDERRLLYVSLTRAKHYLFVTYCQRRKDQQAWTGRDRGQERRTLTRFLEHAPLTPVPGVTYELAAPSRALSG